MPSARISPIVCAMALKHPFSLKKIGLVAARKIKIYYCKISTIQLALELKCSDDFNIS